MDGVAVDRVAVEQAVSALRAAVDQLLAAELGSAAPLALAQVVADVEVERRRLDAADVQVVAALARQAVPADFGATSVPDLIGGLARVTRAEARARAQRSIDLAPQVTLCCAVSRCPRSIRAPRTRSRQGRSRAHRSM